MEVVVPSSANEGDTRVEICRYVHSGPCEAAGVDAPDGRSVICNRNKGADAIVVLDRFLPGPTCCNQRTGIGGRHGRRAGNCKYSAGNGGCKVRRRTRHLDPLIRELQELDVGEAVGAIGMGSACVGDLPAPCDDAQVVIRPVPGKDQRVLAQSAVDGVVAPTAGQEVVAVAAIEIVVAGAAEQPVVALTAEEDVVARAAVQRVASRPMGIEVVALRRSGDAVVPGVAREHIDPGAGHPAHVDVLDAVGQAGDRDQSADGVIVFDGQAGCERGHKNLQGR